MCISATSAMWIAAGVSSAGTLYQGKVASDLANEKAKDEMFLAAQEEEASKEEVKRIRKAGERQAGAARAALAASGVSVDEGTAININQDINQRTEDDAFQTLLTGQRKVGALNRSASYSYASGQNAQTSSVLSAGSTLAFAGWKSVPQSVKDQRIS